MSSASFVRVGVGLATKAPYFAALVALAGVLGVFILGGANCFGSQTVNVGVSDNIQALVNQYPAGTTFSLAPGFHRLQTIVPKNSDVFAGQTGAVLSGAAELTSFTKSGVYWTATVSNVWQAASYPGVCGPTHPTCMYPEDLFFNNIPEARVAALASVSAGRWYLDYGTGTVYMADDPSGYTVEISEIPYAFTGSAVSVTISNLTIEKYACVAQQGAINGAAGGTWWNIEGNQVRLNHGRGITTGNGMFIDHNNVYSNGQLGIGGGGTNFTLQSNQVAYNNYGGYSYYWEAGGVKLSSVRNVRIEYNYSHNNAGPGFWNDINSQWVTYDQNQASANVEAGIITEISSYITISNNNIWDDAYNSDGSGLWWGAGILVENSANTVIYSNVVSNCMDGIGGVLAQRGNDPGGQPYLLENVSVFNNTITQGAGIAAGIVVEGSGFDNSVYTSWNNLFQSNNYVLANPAGNYFYWLGGAKSLSVFNALLGIL